ncbi:MAG: VanZ family protein [Clostridia bacterium]|nr:VanZ family protein [Clostridia bacterium]
MNKKLLRIIFLILTILIMAVIFWFSHQTGEQSATVSTSLTERLLSFFYRGFNGLDLETKQQLLSDFSVLLRVGAHFCIFMLLGICFTAFLLTFSLKNIKVLLLNAAFCLFYALTDELHQHFVSGRAFELFDIAVDTCGALFAAAAVLLVKKIQKIKAN